MGQPVMTDRLAVWRDVIRDHFVALEIAAHREDSFAGRVRSTDLGHLNVASVESSTQECTRTSHLARTDDEVYLQVGLLARGDAVLAQDGREAVLAPGDFAVYETDRPFCWGLQSDWELLVFTWPRTSIPLDTVESQSLTARRLRGDTGLGAIVSRLLRDLVLTPPELSPAGYVRLGTEVAELVTTVATECVQPSGRQRSTDDLLQRIDHYIVEHLSDLALRPAQIAAAHFISTRHLHRLFGGRGDTVAQRIQHLRLERARLELLRPACDARSITEISRRWGFPDLAAFSRAFRATYGMTPTECRGARGAGRIRGPAM